MAVVLGPADESPNSMGIWYGVVRTFVEVDASTCLGRPHYVYEDDKAKIFE